DASLVPREALEVSLLEPLDAEHRIPATRIQVERPAALVVRRPADAQRQHLLQAEQSPDDDRPVGPRAGPRDHQAISARLDRIAVLTVDGDARRNVVLASLELTIGHVGHIHQIKDPPRVPGEPGLLVSLPGPTIFDRIARLAGVIRGIAVRRGPATGLVATAAAIVVAVVVAA